MSFHTQPRGYALTGTIWPGGAADEINGTVVVDATGAVAQLIAADATDATRHFSGLPSDLPVFALGWVGPAIIDAHVHMGFGSFERQRDRGVVAVRDLGSPPELIEQWRADAVADTSAPPVHLTTVGPLLTAPGGYPSTSWGADGYARFVADPSEANAAVAARVAEGVDLIKLALEPSGKAPVPSLETARAIVEAAHDAGLRVTCHALSSAMVDRALDAGVDELCHTPIDPLSRKQVQRIVESGVTVCSTLQTFWSGNERNGASASDNAAKLLAAGVTITYGTDLGNAGTRDGIDSRELRRLADAGMGIAGALRAATEGAAQAPGIDGRAGDGRITIGEKARLLGLRSSPLTRADPWSAWDALPFVAVGTWTTGAPDPSGSTV